MSQPMFPQARAACRRWFTDEDVEVNRLPSAGFSGASAWDVRHGGRGFVLKNFVASASRMHAEWVHSLMRHVRAAGHHQVPEVVAGRDGSSVQAEPDGTLWELLERMPGRPTDRPTLAQAAAAGELLARLHQAAATMPGGMEKYGIPASLQRRITGGRDLLARPWTMRDPDAAPPGIRPRFMRAADILATTVGAQALAAMASATAAPYPLQPVLRDVWSDHLLFDASRVVGVIDWHAAGIDIPATDIARILGSWPDDPGIAGEVIEGYAKIRPIDPAWLTLIPFLRASGIVLGLDNWFRWTMEEGRRFADMSMVEHRIDALLATLPAAIDMLARRAVCLG
ncbi:MAG: phosphotransferase enzyme family protein [Planctomycetia bacterium]